MEVTEEEYQRYFRPWWRQKKREQRNREAMEEKGYTEESYEEWKENDMRDELFAEDTEELAECRNDTFLKIGNEITKLFQKPFDTN